MGKLMNFIFKRKPTKEKVRHYNVIEIPDDLKSELGDDEIAMDIPANGLSSAPDIPHEEPASTSGDEKSAFKTPPDEIATKACNHEVEPKSDDDEMAMKLWNFILEHVSHHEKSLIRFSPDVKALKSGDDKIKIAKELWNIMMESTSYGEASTTAFLSDSLTFTSEDDKSTTEFHHADPASESGHDKKGIEFSLVRFTSKSDGDKSATEFFQGDQAFKSGDVNSVTEVHCNCKEVASVFPPNVDFTSEDHLEHKALQLTLPSILPTIKEETKVTTKELAPKSSHEKMDIEFCLVGLTSNSPEDKTAKEFPQKVQSPNSGYVNHATEVPCNCREVAIAFPPNVGFTSKDRLEHKALRLTLQSILPTITEESEDTTEDLTSKFGHEEKDIEFLSDSLASTSEDHERATEFQQGDLASKTGHDKRAIEFSLVGLTSKSDGDKNATEFGQGYHAFKSGDVNSATVVPCNFGEVTIVFPPNVGFTSEDRLEHKDMRLTLKSKLPTIKEESKIWRKRKAIKKRFGNKVSTIGKNFKK